MSERKKAWLSSISDWFTLTPNTTGVSQSFIVYDQALTAQLYDEPTVIRTLYEFTATIGGGATPTNYAGVFGGIVLDSITGTPNPYNIFTDGDADWLWWHPFHITNIYGVTGADSSIVRYHGDIKARRRINRKQQFLAVLGIRSTTPSPNTVAYGYAVRSLLLI